MTDERRPIDEASAEGASSAVERLAGELEGVRQFERGGAVEYDRAGVVFATRESGTLTFRLRPEIAEVALKTPGTGRSTRGSGWVALAATEGGAFTRDRAAAWFESAWRLAGEEPGATV